MSRILPRNIPVDVILTERLILEDIRNKTGLTFRQIGGIDTRNPDVFSTVTPILVEWVERLSKDFDLSLDRHDWSDARFRGYIYSRFLTPLARQYLEQIVLWWETESDLVAQGVLTQVLTVVITCAEAERIWKLLRTLRQPQFYFMLAAKLSACASVRREIRNELIEALGKGGLSASELSYIAQVKDPRIGPWFAQQVESPDPAIRTLAKRVIARGGALPRDLKYMPISPETRLSAAVFSTECDLDQIKSVLQEAVKQHGLRLTAVIARGSFLSAADPNRWLMAPISTKQGEPATIWFRLEDIDTVQVMVFIGEASGTGSTSRQTEVLQ